MDIFNLSDFFIVKSYARIFSSVRTRTFKVDLCLESLKQFGVQLIVSPVSHR